MDNLKLGISLLLLNYGFIISYHLMGAAKYINMHEFDVKKFFLGVLRELGFVIFWFLVCVIQRYLDLTTLGIDIDIASIINIILIAPLSNSIKKAYQKAIELREVKDTASDKIIVEVHEPNIKTPLVEEGGLG